MATHFPVAVAHYGIPALRVKHCVIVVMLDSSNGLAYQITGSTTNYTMKAIEFITLLDSSTFLGKVSTTLFFYLAYFLL